MSCSRPIFFFFYHDFCDYDTISAFPLSIQSVCFLAVHCRINFSRDDTAMERSRRAACIPRSTKTKHESMAWHGINGRQKLHIILDKIVLGFYIAGVF